MSHNVAVIGNLTRCGNCGTFILFNRLARGLGGEFEAAACDLAYFFDYVKLRLTQCSELLRMCYMSSDAA